MARASTDPALKAPLSDAVYRGQAVYTPRLLAWYDLLVLRLSNTLVWRCPSRRILDLYNEHVSATHLDIGVGTGYFLDRCRFPNSSPRITLMDLNPNCLRKASRRLGRYRPTTHQANVLEPSGLEAGSFDSIGMNYLLHCLPGDIGSKSVIFEHAKPLLKPNGVLFGSTILSGGVKHSALSRRIMAHYNEQVGSFSNTEDDLAGLEQSLGQHFGKHHVDVIGSVALFVGID